MPEARVVILGGGAAGQAAHALLPAARLVTRPAETAWHAEPGLLWIWREGAAEAVPFDALILAAPVLQIALALGCHAEGWRPVVDEGGRTSVPNVWAAGCIIGAASAVEAAEQGRIAAQGLLGLPPENAVTAREPAHEALPPGIACACLGVTEAAVAASGLAGLPAIADFFALRTGECRLARCGPFLGDPVAVAPAVPVPIAALAAIARERPEPRPRQMDDFLR